MTIGNYSTAFNNDLEFSETEAKNRIGKDARYAEKCEECIYGCDSVDECTNSFGLCGLGEKKRVKAQRRRLTSHEYL